MPLAWIGETGRRVGAIDERALLWRWGPQRRLPVRALGVAREGYDPVYGARPLKRFLQRTLETRIGQALIAGEVTEGSLIEVGMKDGGLDVRVRGVRPSGREAAAVA